MKRYLLFLLLLWGSGAAWSQTLQGKVLDSDKKPVEFATVTVSQNGVVKGGAVVDDRGNYVVDQLDAGTYDVEASYIGFTPQRVTGVSCGSGRLVKLDFSLEKSDVALKEVIVTSYKNPIINFDNTSQGGAKTGEQIKNLPTVSLGAIASSIAGVSQASDKNGNSFSIRGSRDDANEIYVDGVRVRGGATPPTQDIEELEVVTGGLSAAIGDVTGGGVFITTKSGSSKWTGGVEAETSQFLDPYGYNRVNANISGPLVKGKDGESPLVSFRLSGQYQTRKDQEPSGIDLHTVKDDVRNSINADPLMIYKGSLTPRAYFLTENDITTTSVRPNMNDARSSLNAKLDFHVAKQVDIAVGARFTGVDAKYNSGNNNLSRYLLSYDHIGTDRSNQYVIWGRIRHRISSPNSKGTIQNASYSIQFDYSRFDRTTADPTQGDNLWNYGYVGKFAHHQNPTAVIQDSTAALGKYEYYSAYTTVFDGYQAGTVNPGLSAYNSHVKDLYGDKPLEGTYPMQNGQFGSTGSLYGLHSNSNQPLDLYRKNSLNQYSANLKANFDIVPNNDKSRRHSIEIGGLYEQREDRSYSLAPVFLWEAARGSVNKFNGIDRNSVKKVETVVNAAGDTVKRYTYDNFQSPADQTTFDKRLRAALGVKDYSYVDVDALSPDQLKVSYFSPDELGRNRNVGLTYYGYDYTGTPLTGRVTFYDFFNAKTISGTDTFKTRPIAAFQPIYIAGYIQDKFQFNDVIFRVGLRVERYDANTQVLKDPYNFYEAYTASEWSAAHAGVVKPGAVPDNATTYVDDGNTVKAYRSGDTWYDKSGSIVNDPIYIFGSQKSKPALKTPGSEYEVKGDRFDPKKTFVDYTPQVNILPRLAFSFPISDNAGFFAHYDILTQRPTTGQIATAADYFYFEDEVNGGGVFSNPNLRPTRTIDYEVGFQQALSRTTGIKVQAYYKELRDMIQQRNIAYAYPLPYVTYDNVDFGTVKGLSFTFDQRRVNNLEYQVAYTLQFADGTGSSATSSRGLSGTGLLRTIYPLSFDERHRFSVTLDYRYGEGKQYNGPELFGSKFLERTGINLLVGLTSGRPYTQKSLAQGIDTYTNTVGSLNGARLPWTSHVDLRIDKDFLVSSKTAKKPLYLNVYFRVQNLLNTQNILQIYPVSQSANDDGYLNSPKGQQALSSSSTPTNFALLYQYRMLNPEFFDLPRRMFIGARFDF